MDSRTRGQVAARLRQNLIVALTTAMFVAIAAAVAVMLNEFGFKREKREILNTAYNDGELISLPLTNTLLTMAQDYLAPLEAAVPMREQFRARLQQQMETVAERSGALVRVELVTAEGVVLKTERPERLRRQNDWSNSLVPGDVVVRISRPVYSRDQTQRRGYLRIELTTPPAEAMTPPVREALAEAVGAWRGWLAVALVAVLLAYVLTLFGLLLPVRRVMDAMSAGMGGTAIPIARPRTKLESIYNEMAVDAILSRFARALRERIESAATPDSQALLSFVPELLRAHAGIAAGRVYAWTPKASGRGAQELPATVGAPEWTLGCGLAAALDSALAQQAAAGVERPLSFSDPQGRRRHALATPIEREGELEYLLVVHAPPPSYSDRSLSEHRALHRKLADEVANALRTAGARRRQILQEKSKANVSLSRNLGHDLTNIIATQKLELMTVRNFLRLAPEELAAAPQKREIFRESLQSLLNNTRFMQEIVNLYRSFAFLSRPKFERVELGELAQNVCDLFAISSSARIRVSTQAEEGLPPVEVEPRLLRLALFNLLTNAVDAIKRGSTAESPEGAIEIVVRSATPGRQEIAVRDSGPGIRSEEGRLLTPEEIGTVFRLGYTTKGEGEGEGLGLNWVQAIVTDFHGGSIAAANRPEGGAEFVLSLPVEGAAAHQSPSGDANRTADS